MKLIIVEDYDDMSNKASDLVLDMIRKDHEMSICFPTGATPLGMYSELAKSYEKGKEDLSKIITFNLDEYYPISQDDANSFYQYMRNHLFDKVKIPVSNIHFLNGQARGTVSECRRYDILLSNQQIDLQILGIGSNGHIGFNEPGTSFETRTRKVTLSDETRQANSRFFGDDLSKVPKHALSMGIKNILEAKNILLLASGKEKAEAIKAMLEGDINKSCPASALRNHTSCTVIVDKEAASLLSDSHKNIFKQ